MAILVAKTGLPQASDKLPVRGGTVTGTGVPVLAGAHARTLRCTRSESLPGRLGGPSRDSDSATPVGSQLGLQGQRYY